MAVSILTQERLLGAALGGIFTGVLVFEQRRRIYGSISDCNSNSRTHPESTEPLFGQKSRSEFAHLWNQTVDKTLGPVIAFLGARGW